MRKIIRKIISITASLCVLASSLCVGAFADGETVQTIYTTKTINASGDYVIADTATGLISVDVPVSGTGRNMSLSLSGAGGTISGLSVKSTVSGRLSKLALTLKDLTIASPWSGGPVLGFAKSDGVGTPSSSNSLSIAGSVSLSASAGAVIDNGIDRALSVGGSGTLNIYASGSAAGIAGDWTADQSGEPPVEVNIYASGNAAHLSTSSTGESYIDFDSVLLSAPADTFEIAVDGGTPVTLSSAGVNIYRMGESGTWEASAPILRVWMSEGHHTFSVNGEEFKCWFDELDGALTYVPQYAIKLESAPGGLVSASRATAAAGDAVTVSVSPVEDYYFDSASASYTADEAEEAALLELVPSDSGFSFTMPAADVSVAAVFAELPDYSVTALDAENGSVRVESVASPSGSVRYTYDEASAGADVIAKPGDTVVLTVLPDDAEAYGVSTVTSNIMPDGDESYTRAVDSAEGVYSFVMPYADTEVSAVFLPYHNISVDSDQITNGNMSVDVSKAIEGAAVKVTFSPEAGYGAKNLIYTDENGVTQSIDVSGDEYFFIMPGHDVTLYTVFTSLHRITVSTESSTGENTLPLRTTSDKDYAVTGDTVIISSTAPGDADHVTAVTVANATTGEIYATLGSGVEQTSRTMRNAGYSAEARSAYSFVMPDADVSVTVTYVYYHISAPAPENGILSLSVHNIISQSMVNCSGSSNVLRVAPNEGYELVSLTVASTDTGEIKASLDDGSIWLSDEDPTQNIYRFTMPTCDVTATAVFSAAESFNIEISPSENGEVTVAGVYRPSGTATEEAASAKSRDIVDLNVTPGEGYALRSLTLSAGGEITEILPSEDGKYSFTMPESDVTLTAEFSQLRQIQVFDEIQNGSVTPSVPSAISGAAVTVEIAPDEGFGLAVLRYAFPEGGYFDISPNADGNYTFIMPEFGLTLSAVFGAVHSLAVDSTVENGTFQVSPSAAAGAKVTVTPVSKNEHYKIESVSFSTDGETYQAISPDDSGAYTFIMPDADVTVTGTFVSTGEKLSVINGGAVSGAKDVAGLHFSGSLASGVISVDPIEVGEGDTVTVTVSTPDGVYTGFGGVMYSYESYGETVVGYAENADDESYCLSPGGAGTYQFIMPDTDVTVSVRFVSASVWDGVTIDVSWYTPNAGTYYISTPAQLMGLAAIVNGLYNEEIDVVIGNSDHIRANRAEDEADPGSSNMSSTNVYYYGSDSFTDATVYILSDLDMGGASSAGARYMPIGGQYMMYYDDYTTGDTDGMSHLGSSFCGVLDGGGHSIYNVWCDRYVSGSNYGDSQSIGLVGRLGLHDDDAGAMPTNPAVRNICLENGYIRGRRSVGGIVGKFGDSDGIGCIVENCINKATVSGTDTKGTGGIVGAGWNGGVICNCANLGSVSNTMVGGSPAGGISGSNEADILNCFNVGSVAAFWDSYAMAIGTKNARSISLENTYYLAGSAPGGGYYSGSKADNSGEMSQSAMKSAGFADTLNASGTVWLSSGGSYPVLFYQRSGYSSTFSYSHSITIDDEITGGSIAAQTVCGGGYALRTGSTVDDGMSVMLTYEADDGKELDYFTLNGEKVSGSTVYITDDSLLSAIFRDKNTVRLVLPDVNSRYTLTVKKDGIMTGDDGEPQTIEGYVFTDADVMTDTDGRRYIDLYEGDVVSFSAVMAEDAPPHEDVNYDYVGFSFYVRSYYGESDLEGKNHSYDLEDFTVTADITRAELSISLKQELKTWLHEGYYDIDWYDASAPLSSYIISTPYQLAGVSYLLYHGVTDFSGVTLTLSSSLSLENPGGTSGVRYWVPAGTMLCKFCGVFDGGGNSVNIPASYVYSTAAALFGHVNGVVKNVAVSGSLSGDKYAAGIVGCLYGGSITGCQNLATVNAAIESGGGIAGAMYGGTITDCTNRGSVSGKAAIGGIAGSASTGSISGCNNYGSVTASFEKVGGIAGSTVSGCNISGCGNYGTVSGYGNYTGGISGLVTGAGAALSSCFSADVAVINGNGLYTGGVAGGVEAGSTISSCSNAGSVSGSGYTGGVCGRLYSSALTDCSNGGSVTSSGNNSGGVVGCLLGSQLSGSGNTGSVTSYGSNSGGVAGYIYGSTASVNMCINSGEIIAASGGSGIGGIAGYITISANRAAANVTSCVNTGSVSAGGYSGVGGVAGWIYSSSSYATTAALSGCSNSGFVSGGTSTGGILGKISAPYSLSLSVTVSGCGNSGTVQGGTYTGGVAGEIGLNNRASGKISSCVNSASVSGGSSTGGIVGAITGEPSVDAALIGGSAGGKCVNSGSITGGSYTGGIIGNLSRGNVKICENSGSVIASGDCCGGIAGLIGGGNIESCTNTSIISGGSYTGGVAGQVLGGSVRTCINGKSASVNGGGYTGGVAGYIGGGSVSESGNEGSVTGTGETGGVAGYVEQGLSRCMNRGSVSGGGYTGGIAGAVASGSVYACYSNSPIEYAIGSMPSGSIAYCYTTGYSLLMSGGAALSDTYDGAAVDSMTSDELLTALGSEYTVDVLSINAGYPILLWEGDAYVVVTFCNEDGSVLYVSPPMPQYSSVSYEGPTPEKAADLAYSYVFSAWVTQPHGMSEALLSAVGETQTVYARYEGYPNEEQGEDGDGSGTGADPSLPDGGDGGADGTPSGGGESTGGTGESTGSPDGSIDGNGADGTGIEEATLISDSGGGDSVDISESDTPGDATTSSGSGLRFFEIDGGAQDSGASKKSYPTIHTELSHSIFTFVYIMSAALLVFGAISRFVRYKKDTEDS